MSYNKLWMQYYLSLLNLPPPSPSPPPSTSTRTLHRSTRRRPTNTRRRMRYLTNSALFFYYCRQNFPDIIIKIIVYLIINELLCVFYVQRNTPALPNYTIAWFTIIIIIVTLWKKQLFFIPYLVILQWWNVLNWLLHTLSLAFLY